MPRPAPIGSRGKSHPSRSAGECPQAGRAPGKGPYLSTLRYKGTQVNCALRCQFFFSLGATRLARAAGLPCPFLVPCPLSLVPCPFSLVRCSVMKGYANPQLVLSPQDLAPTLVATAAARPLLLDLRPPEAYAAGHIPT